MKSIIRLNSRKIDKENKFVHAGESKYEIADPRKLMQSVQLVSDTYC